MENFVVSARKYRPTTFDSVVGQSSLTTTLKNAIKNKQLAHAYLFCGPRGVGKTTCARIFAKTINCQNLGDNIEACDQCDSCVSFNEQRSFNIHELDAASNNGVDDIRTLIEQVRIPPQVKYSVYIIDEVHMLSQGAYNAFLKTLEEPPAHAIFILATTEKHKIIPTILSRCQIYDFNRITVADTVNHLKNIAEKEGVSIDDNALNIIAHKSDGGLRDALSIFDQIVSFSGNNILYEDVIANLNVLDYDYYFRLVDALLANDIVSTLLILNEVLNKGFDAQHFITGLSTHFRDLLVSKDPQTIILMEVGADIGKKYHAQAQQAQMDFLIQALKISNDCDLNYRNSNNKRLLVELALIQIAQLMSQKKNLTQQEVSNPTIQPINVGQKQVANVAKPTEKTDNQAKDSQTQDSQAKENIVIKTEDTVLEKPVAEVAKPVEKQAEPAQASKAPISISVGAGSKKSSTPKESTPQLGDLNESYTEEALISAWRAYAAKVPKNTGIVSYINSHAPLKIDEHTYELSFSNIFQENDFKKEMSKLSHYLHQALQNSHIKFTTKIEESVQPVKSKNPEESLKQMTSSNPELQHLIQNLKLELD